MFSLILGRLTSTRTLGAAFVADRSFMGAVLTGLIGGACFVVLGTSRRAFAKLVTPGLVSRRRLGDRVFGSNLLSLETSVRLWRIAFFLFGYCLLALAVIGVLAR